MAFNFNWSPLAADTDFYNRAKDLLTRALNKSPKPPIIVDDILVSDFNLGSVPPDLEILEIGDLAEDRFRGIFKMCYSGDASVTLKTRVQVSAIPALCRLAGGVRSRNLLVMRWSQSSCRDASSFPALATPHDSTELWDPPFSLLGRVSF